MTRKYRCSSYFSRRWLLVFHSGIFPSLAACTRASAGDDGTVPAFCGLVGVTVFSLRSAHSMAAWVEVKNGMYHIFVFASFFAFKFGLLGGGRNVRRVTTDRPTDPPL